MRKLITALISIAAVFSFTVSAYATTCASCHREVPDNSIYCTWCGTNLAEAEAIANADADLNPESEVRTPSETVDGVKFETQEASTKVLEYEHVTVTYKGCNLSDGTSICFKFYICNDNVEELQYTNYYCRVGDYMVDPWPAQSLLPHTETEFDLYFTLDELSLLSPKKDEIEIGFALQNINDQLLYASDPVVIPVEGFTGTFTPLYAEEVPAMVSDELNISILGSTMERNVMMVYFTADSTYEYDLWMMGNFEDTCAVNDLPAFCSMTSHITEGKYVYSLLIMGDQLHIGEENSVILPRLSIEDYHHRNIFEETSLYKELEKAGQIQIVFSADGTVKTIL